MNKILLELENHEMFYGQLESNVEPSLDYPDYYIKDFEDDPYGDMFCTQNHLLEEGY